jgi:hypothetical protein
VTPGARPTATARHDALALAVALAVVPLTWWLLLGWSWPLGLFGYDDLTLPGLLAVREMVAQREGWSALVYRAELMGGVKGANVNGRFPLYDLGGLLGLDPVLVSVVSAFIVQGLLAYLGGRAATDLAGAWTGGARRPRVPERIALVWLCAFMPALGWRFGVGHPALVIGLLPFAAALALVTAAAARTVTAVLVAAAAASVVLGLLHVGQQLIVYAALFGTPVLLGVWLTLGAPKRRLVVPGLVLAGATLMALPGLWGLLVQASSTDSPRLLGGAAVTYSLLTATARDWLTSLPWMRLPPVPGFRSVFEHEVNYPVGPMLLLLALVPWRRARALGAGLGVALLGILVFSMDAAPLSRALLGAVPVLGVFRVPARAALIWLWLLPIVASAAVLYRDGAAEGSTSTRRGVLAAAVAACGAVLVLPPALRELVALALVVAVVLRAPGLPAALVLLLLGLASVAAFRERLPALPTPRAVFEAADQLGTAVRRAAPRLDSALARVRLDVELPGLHANTAFAAGLSSLDGYAVPTRRFSALVYALRGEPYNPTGNIVQLPANDPAFRLLAQLYNVGDHIRSTPGGGRALTVTPLGPTAGAAWFSAGVVRLGGLPELVRELRAAGDELHTHVREVLWLDASDPLAARATTATPDARCREALVREVTAPRRGPAIVARVTTPADCPLTFAANFTEDLRARASLADGHEVTLAVYPAYHALAGVVVPRGATSIRLHAEPVRLPGGAAWVVLGVALCVTAVWLTHRE